MNTQKSNIKKSILNALKLNLCGCKSSKMITNKNNDYEFVSYQPITVVDHDHPSIEIKRSNKLVKQNGQTNLQPTSYVNELNELTCDDLNFNNETCSNKFHSTKLDWNAKDTQLNFQETIEEQENEEQDDEETYNRYILITTQIEQQDNQQINVEDKEENESLYDDYLEQVDYDLIFKSISQKQRNMKLTSTIIKQQTKMLIKNGYQTTTTPKSKQQYQHQQRESTRFTNYDSTFSTANTTFEQTYSRYSTINSSCDTTLSNNTSSSSSSNESSFDFSSQQFNFESTRNNQIENNKRQRQRQEDGSEELFICVSEYKAKLSGDLNLNLNDKVKIVYNNQNKSPATTNNFVLVQLIESSNKYQQENLGQYGFVPRKCIRNY